MKKLNQIEEALIMAIGAMTIFSPKSQTLKELKLALKNLDQLKAQDKAAKIGYLCGVDWQHDIDQDAEVYASPKLLEDAKGCVVQGCGIVKVKMTEVKWVKPQKLF